MFCALNIHDGILSFARVGYFSLFLTMNDGDLEVGYSMKGGPRFTLDGIPLSCKVRGVTSQKTSIQIV